jgi:hypothetical protein
MVYAVVSKTTSRKAVWVRLPLSAPDILRQMSFIISTLIFWIFISVLSYAIAAFSDRRIYNIIGLALFLSLIILIVPAATPRQDTYKTNSRPYFPFYNCYVLEGCRWEKHDQGYLVNYKNDLPNWIIRIIPPFLFGTIFGFNTKKNTSAKIRAHKS